MSVPLSVALAKLWHINSCFTFLGLLTCYRVKFPSQNGAKEMGTAVGGRGFHVTTTKSDVGSGASVPFIMVP